MASVKITTDNRILNFGNKELYAINPIIRRYFWKIEGDTVSPYLLVDSGDGSSFSLKLEGNLYLDLGEKYCQICGELIPRDSSESICTNCFESNYYRCRRCIFEGPGIPFGESCTKEKFPCQSLDNQLRCFGDHYLYIGRFGNILKVGTSYSKRSDGNYYRLIEQGLNEAVVFKGFSSLHDVLAAEARISDYCNYTTALPFMDKVEQLQPTTNTSIDFNWHRIAKNILEIYPEKKASYIDLSGLWSQTILSEPIKTVWNPLTISGEIVFSRGNILLVKEQPSSKNVLGINLSRLVGFEINTDDQYFIDISEEQLAMQEEEM